MSGLLQAFADGFINPLTTPAHVLVLLALALLLARQPQRYAVLLVFALALAAGFVAIVLAVETTPARTVLLAVAAALGVMVAAAWAPKLLAWLFAAIAGAALALDSPPQAVTIAQAYATLCGTAVGACAMLVLVAAIAAHANADWQRLGLRILGSWIAASAILVLAVQLR
jgi:hydrogenase/urease accessory protein HupE